MQLVLGSLELAPEFFYDFPLIILVEKSRILRPEGKRAELQKRNVAIEKKFRIAKDNFSHDRRLWNERICKYNLN